MLEKLANAPTRLKSFYFDVKRELRKVTWPSRNEVYGTTAVVLISVFFFGFYLFFVDMILSTLVDRVFEFFR